MLMHFQKGFKEAELKQLVLVNLLDLCISAAVDKGLSQLLFEL